MGGRAGGENKAGGRTLEWREGGGTEKSICSTLILLLAIGAGGGVGDQDLLVAGALFLGGGGLGSRGTTSSWS